RSWVTRVASRLLDEINQICSGPDALSLAVTSRPFWSASQTGCPTLLHRLEVSGLYEPSATLIPITVSYRPRSSVSLAWQAMVLPSGDHAGAFQSIRKNSGCRSTASARSLVPSVLAIRRRLRLLSPLTNVIRLPSGEKSSG